MNTDRLQILMAVHHELVAAASLPETTRPFSIQSRLEKLQIEIMKEIEQKEQPPAPTAKTTDDIPF